VERISPRRLNADKELILRGSGGQAGRFLLNCTDGSQRLSIGAALMREVASGPSKLGVNEMVALRRTGSGFLMILFLGVWAAALSAPTGPAATGPDNDHSIQAIRYASAEDEVAGLVMGAPKGEKINIAMVV
jgi:hypothetical protein